ncbi:glutaminyl-peptide cyclotransferase [Neobacillus bataviensis LMG 21833]|uniref:Glutaminyl-peptide cyclotransferase n=1 Tax=Neobacillus bataviensis LMG 21833 TaxID=1117379 RepID=K6DE83_9BACI|nr:M20/M25/M40 family metallo-hydrolase [Neobacillus bataviensis]EKN70852.1 glutaminyl-peptide cyclotransferase [Neobacillus bataviensis LMG 21833]
MKKKITVSIIAMLFSLLTIVGGASAQTVTYKPSLVHKNGAMAYEHMKYLAYEIGSRVAGSVNERKAEEYIESQFGRIGFNTTVQDFSYTRSGKTTESSNVIAYKPGKSNKQIIVGAHYDSVSLGRGVDDNASGVGILLEVAEVLKNIPTPYSIVFIAFGAEETGLRGSDYYAKHMTQKEIENTIGMINMDSLAVGDNMYVYGSPGEAGFIRDQAIEIVKKKKLNVGTNPGINPEYPAGTTGDWSDHAPFERLGIPYGYLEATNWEIGDLDGYDQTVKHGGVWHTRNDTLEFIESEYPGRIQEHLSTFSTLLTDLLKFMDKTSTSK